MLYSWQRHAVTAYESVRCRQPITTVRYCTYKNLVADHSCVYVALFQEVFFHLFQLFCGQVGVGLMHVLVQMSGVKLNLFKLN